MQQCPAVTTGEADGTPTGTPARSALLAGYYPSSIGMGMDSQGAFTISSPYGVGLEHTLLPEAMREIFLQGSSSFKLPKNHVAVKVYCSPHNPGARELAHELNGVWLGLLQLR